MSLWERLRKSIEKSHSVSPSGETDHSGKHEAEMAKENAQLNLRQVRRTGTEISQVAESLRQLRARNHFGEAVQLAMMARKRG